jgi:hypothetical protein
MFWGGTSLCPNLSFRRVRRVWHKPAAFGQGLRLALPVLPLTSSSLLPLLSHR